MKRLIPILSILIVSLMLSGCSISFKGSKTADGGVYQSINSGHDWQAKNYVGKSGKKDIYISNVNTGILIFDPNDKNKVYLGTLENGIFMSSDAAEHWQQLGIRSGNFSTISIDPKTPDIIYTASGGNILKSTDAGQTWQIIYTESRAGQAFTQVAVDFYNPAQIYATTNGGELLKSEDYGNTWKILKLFNGSIRKFYFLPDNSQVIYIVIENGGLMRSSDAGNTWIDLNANLKKYSGAININWLSFDQNPNIIYLASTYGILKSTDAGQTWQTLKTLIPNNTLPIQVIVVSPKNSNEIYLSVQNKIHKSINGGQDWQTINTPTSRLIDFLLINPANPQIIYFGSRSVKK